MPDRRWDRIAAHIVGDSPTHGRRDRDSRMFAEAVPSSVHAGSPRRDPLEMSGASHPAVRRFGRGKRDAGKPPDTLSPSLPSQLSYPGSDTGPPNRGTRGFPEDIGGALQVGIGLIRWIAGLDG